MRRITSIILTITFIVLAVSGVQMAVIPKSPNAHQQVANNSGGDQVMARREMPFYPKKAHEWAGYLFIGAGLVHIGLNRKSMLSHFGFKNSSK
ncbi:hypothetical protein P22_1193 [Propionispora sp. 2/2-37]|uniref:DUF4405 domain-containing protein n=1 Tax=Propionispora sp. 2/2-37 TaxID=1677858 RepID=UPI0006BB91F5|nr:DUF4405 domain-containing protein [Propionispora sp. 2/2-37]CUH95124.1 hypothetical protein P22_1193 [Propionispora sp. 2/2-37]